MDEMRLRLPYGSALDWTVTLSFLGRRAIDGVERIDGSVYRRTVRLGDATGVLAVAHDEPGRALVASVRGLPAADAETVRARLRRMFDLDADLAKIVVGLSRDPIMAALVAARPALRVFGGWDGFEIAARTVIGQQVSVERARRLNGALVERCGSRLPADDGGHLNRVFPAAQQVRDGDLSAMGMPGARVKALTAVAAAAMADARVFEPAGSLDKTIARLRAIRGVGDWTAHYIAMRACREPDAFPASDVGLLRAAADGSGRRPTPAELMARAEAWRPFRAYAAHHLWAL